MQCSVCQTINREGARFCKECGTFLAPLCPQCRRELPDHANFCDACGFALTEPTRATIPPPTPAKQTPRALSQYTVPLPPPLTETRLANADAASAEQTKLQQYIPKELLHKLNAAVAGGGLSSERRVVTMLFCDVKGSTAAAEQLDPEDWTDVINGAFEHMIKSIR